MNWLGAALKAQHCAGMIVAAPPSRHRTLLAATVIVWLFAWGAWTADWLLTPMVDMAGRATRRIPICVLGALLCWGLLRPLLTATAPRPMIRLLLALALCIAASLTLSAGGQVLFYVIAPHWGEASVSNWLAGALSDFWVFAAWTALYVALDLDLVARDSRLALADAHGALLEARNLALVRQIDPHFLFNALNTVSGLIGEGETARADATTLALARLLRGAFQRDPPPFRTLGEELAAQSAYLEVQHARFPDRFTLVTDVPASLLDDRVPTLILQPLIENAFTHGVARSEGCVTLTIAARAEAGGLLIAVSDDATGRYIARHRGDGMGLENVAHRLAALYGGRAQHSYGPLAERGWRVKLLIPPETV